MALGKITSGMVADKGVLPLGDIPNLEADEMKYKFEEIVREVVIPSLNKNAENTYDKGETESLIEKRVVDLGLADMRMDRYDPQNRGLDVYAYADEVGERIVSDSGGVLYVEVGGSDTAGDGSAEKPYRTCRRAFAQIPFIVNGDYTVKLGRGAFGEVVSLRGRSGGGSVTIEGTSDEVATAADTAVLQVHVAFCSCLVVVTNLYAASPTERSSGDIYLQGCAYTKTAYCGVGGKRGIGVRVYGGSAHVFNCAMTGKGEAVRAEFGAVLSTEDLLGSGNTTGLSVNMGIICHTGNKPGALVAFSETGGRVFT